MSTSVSARPFLIACALTAACSESPVVDEAPGTADTHVIPVRECVIGEDLREGDCVSRNSDAWPRDGATDAAPEGPLVARFDEDRRDQVKLVLWDAAGDEVPLADPTWSRLSGTQVETAPLAPLTEGATYRLSRCLDCGATAMSTFVVHKPGPLADPPVLLGRSYAINLDTTHALGVLADVGYSARNLISRTIAGSWLVVTPRVWTAATRTLSVDVDGGLLHDETWSQGRCVPTQRMELTLDAHGRFDTVTSPWTRVDWLGGLHEIPSVAVSGAFVGGGAALSGVRARVTVEASEAEHALGNGGSQGPCWLAEWTEGVLSCVPCGDGSDSCLVFEFVARAGAVIDGWSPVPRSGEEVAADESCRGGAGFVR